MLLKTIKQRLSPCYRSPLQAVGQGLAAGFGATLLLSTAARLMPGMHEYAQGGQQPPQPPRDPENHEAVLEWQIKSWSPAAAQDKTPKQEPTDKVEVTPAHALTQPEGPGPEGLAEQFAFKVASGLFDRDISGAVRPAGLATHFLYGSAWGGLYGLIRASTSDEFELRHELATWGALYGLLVWLVGPALLVPAMKIMRPPTQEPPLRNATLILGHILYGGCLAGLFHAQSKKES